MSFCDIFISFTFNDMLKLGELFVDVAWLCRSPLIPPTEEADGLPDHSSLPYLLGLNTPSDHRDAAEAQESIKAKVNAIRKKLVEQV